MTIETSTPAPPERRPPGRPRGCLVTLLTMALVLGWMGVTGVVTVILALLYAGGTDLERVARELERGVAPEAMNAASQVYAFASLFQFGGMLAIVLGMNWLAGYGTRGGLALRRGPLLVLVAGLLGGLTVGLFPGWIARMLMEYLPGLDLGALEGLTQALLQAGPLAGAALVFAIVIAAPVVEELLYRGLLWRALSEELPPWGVWLGTSVLFALNHIDPVHVTAVLFTGLFLGWLRWMSGSVWPCIAAHLVNNALAVALTFYMGSITDDLEVTAMPALIAGLVTLAIGALAWYGRGRSPR